jgi:serine/threonine protein phosphatase 1
LSFFSKLFRPKNSLESRVPDGAWVAAIGDIHGQLDALSILIGKLMVLAAKCQATTKSLVFVGDYIDRGVKSRQVIDLMIKGFPGYETHFLRGNHDDTLLQFLEDPTVGEAWRNFGGLETLASYGVARSLGGDWGRVRDELKAKLPDSHLEFFRQLKPYVQIGDYIFVHAGLRPGIPLQAQSPQDMMWIRDEFLNSNANFGAIVVHGHTPTPQPVIRKNRIGIDTGAYSTGRLTALVLEGRERTLLASQ